MIFEQPFKVGERWNWVKWNVDETHSIEIDHEKLLLHSAEQTSNNGLL